MSKWLITLTYHLLTKNNSGNGLRSISPTTVYFQSSKNCFVEFAGEYPTETEINRLVKENTKKELYLQQYIDKSIPVITFMQKLGEVEE